VTVHRRDGLDRAELEGGGADVPRGAVDAHQVLVVRTDRDEHHRTELPRAVARLVYVQRLLHVEVELDHEHLAADHLEAAARIQVELAVARQVRVIPVGLGLGHAVGVALDEREVREGQAHLRIRADRHGGIDRKEIREVAHRKHVDGALARVQAGGSTAVGQQVDARDGGAHLAEVVGRCVGEQHRHAAGREGRRAISVAAAAAARREQQRRRGRGECLGGGPPRDVV
jgi:hypothetical protein